MVEIFSNWSLGNSRLFLNGDHSLAEAKFGHIRLLVHRLEMISLHAHFFGMFKIVHSKRNSHVT